jgi:hypothetical protein
MMDVTTWWFAADIVVCGWGGCAPIAGGEDALWEAVRSALPSGRTAVVLSIKSNFVSEFFTQHWAAIQRAALPVVLVTSQGDDAPPMPAVWDKLDDPLLVAWFTQNLRVLHPKARPLPIGFEPRWHGPWLPQFLAKSRERAAQSDPHRLLFVNFGHTHISRTELSNVIVSRRWDTWATVTMEFIPKLRRNIVSKTLANTGYSSVMEAIADHKFVLAVRGNGIDTYRTWLVSL